MLKTSCYDEDDDGMTNTTEDITKAMRASNLHDKICKEIQTIKSSLDERMLGLEKLGKTSLVDTTHKAVLSKVKGLLAPRM